MTRTAPSAAARPARAASWRIGVDIGGTFTDVVLVEETTGRVEVVKVPTTPRDFAHGVLGALEPRGRDGVPPDIRYSVPS